MIDVLIYGDTYRCSELRHEIPVGIPDPFLYAERDGSRHAHITSLEIPRLAEFRDVELHTWESLGFDDLVAKGMSRREAQQEVVLRAVKRLGIVAAAVPDRFPLHIADLLRADGVELEIDKELFEDRRRIKNESELAGIRRAQRAAEAGMDVARDLLRRATEGDEGLETEGQPLTSERIKIAIAHACLANGASLPEAIVSHGPQAAIGHDMGAGQLQVSETVVIDLWPRDNISACHADMTRTYVVGDVPNEVEDWFGLVKQALSRSLAAIRNDTTGKTAYDAACDVFEAAGHQTGRTKVPGIPLEDGFFHGLGHGVGIDVHEAPLLGRASSDVLRAGDVITLEPGLYRRGFGGVRLENLFLVTADGAQSLTDYPHCLSP